MSQDDKNRMRAMQEKYWFGFWKDHPTTFWLVHNISKNPVIHFVGSMIESFGENKKASTGNEGKGQS